MVDDPRVQVAALTRDDAAVFRLSDDRSVVATVDFFTPIVDDPYDFGAIAAANAFSDLYAMGASPLFALNLVAWPREPELLSLLPEVIRGGSDITARAGAFVLGGHSIDDREPKFGLVAIGEVHPTRVVSNANAQPGDVLVLTKPVGTGILSTALKRDFITASEMRPAIESMTTLNAGAATAMRSIGDDLHAATDVTGFGLLGHLNAMLAASNVSAVLRASAVPPFAGVAQLIGRGAVPGGTTRNLEAAQDYVTWHTTIDETTRVLLADAQTSGGLLIAAASRSVRALTEALEHAHTPISVVIGEVVAGVPGRIEVLP